MCGIYGWLGKENVSAGQIKNRLENILDHRGPNDRGFESGKNWGLGFNRLSILDLSASGHQPMSSVDKRYWLIFNGEIYNYIELKNEFLKDEVFQSESDTEVLLKLLIKYKEQALEKINGMFAFVFVDTLSERFIAGRDRLGQKPFYYFHENGLLRFSSELKVLAKWPNANLRVNDKAVVEYLSLNYLSTETCIFQNCHKLAPGHFIQGRIDGLSEIRQQKYWEPEINDFREHDEKHLFEEFEALFQNAVDIRMRSDVPVGIFLSGGIDSGLVAAFCANSNKEKIKAYSVSFREQEFDEFDLAKKTAQHCGITLEKILLQKESLNQIDDLAQYYDEPFGDSSALPSFNLCKAASDHAVVFLSGDGGDESFAGYERYFKYLQFQNTIQNTSSFSTLFKAVLKFLPAQHSFSRKLHKLSQPELTSAFFDGLPVQPYYRHLLKKSSHVFQSEIIEDLLSKWRSNKHNSITARQQLFDEKLYLPDDILVKMDRASMANSIEVRSPFLDYRVVEFANSIDRSLLINKSKGKLILRKLASKYLPKEVTTASKKGFSIPVNQWFREQQGQNMLQDRIVNNNSFLNAYINKEYLLKLMNLHKENPKHQFGSLFWRLLMIEAWAEKYVG